MKNKGVGAGLPPFFPLVFALLTTFPLGEGFFFVKKTKNLLTFPFLEGICCIQNKAGAARKAGKEESRR